MTNFIFDTIYNPYVSEKKEANTMDSHVSEKNDVKTTYRQVMRVMMRKSRTDTVLRRMTRIPWTANATNNDYLEVAHISKTLYIAIKKHTPFFGQVMRSEAMNNIVTTGKINGR